MKYTSYLLKGNHLNHQQFAPKNKIGRWFWSIATIIFSFCMLWFCFLLLPITFSTDMARSAYCLEIKIARKLHKKDSLHKPKEYTLPGIIGRVAGLLTL
jgi:hypothetical protein